MSTLWTPGGERPVRPAGATGGPSGPSGSGRGAASAATTSGVRAPGPGGAGRTDAGPSAEERAEALRQIEEAQKSLLAAPVEEIVANHWYGLFELAAVYLSARPPALDKARLAIDTLGCLVEGLEGRLGAAEPEMRDALAKIRVAFVQIQKAPEATGRPNGAGAGTSADSNAAARAAGTEAESPQQGARTEAESPEQGARTEAESPEQGADTHSGGADPASPA